ncbi:hypothetical protein, partial [Sphingobium sp. LSP13-1-1.1]|uniref:hypothetical protein n=1 Tax=Sphingobium sp. LSP13-1-1.1 TaxID=3135234 RepID=UPI00343B2E2A
TAGGGDIRFPSTGGITVGPNNQVFHQGNFNPATKADLTGGTFTGGITVPNVTFPGTGGPFLYRDSNNGSFNIRVGATGAEKYLS